MTDDTDKSLSTAGRNGGTLTPYDSARATAAARRRWDRRAAAVRQGLRDAAQLLTEKTDLTLPGGAPLQNEYDVLRVVGSQHALHAADPSAPGSVQSLKLVSEMAFPRPEPSAITAPSVPPGGLAVVLTPELARELLAAMREKRPAGQVIEHTPAPAKNF